MRAWMIPLAAAAACGTPTPSDTTDETDDVVIDTAEEDTFGNDTEETDPVDTDETDETDDTDLVDTDNQPPVSSCNLTPTIGLTDVCDLSVNEADATTGGISGAPLLLDVLTSAQPAAVGAFNGTGRGNRAIAGLHGYSRRKLSELVSISFDAEKTTGSLPLELFLQVDLVCDGTSFVLLTVGGEDWPTPAPVADAIQRWTAEASAQVWSAQGGLPDPDDPFGEAPLLYDAGDPDGGPATLAPLLGVYPDACIRNFAAGFRDLPASPRAASGVLLAVGSSTTWSLRGQWKVWRWTFNDDVHLPLP